MKTCINKLRSCKTYAEAEKILETQGAGKASKELLRLGFAVKEKQPDIFENNLQTVIQEIEDDEEEKKKNMDTTEIDGGESHASTTTGELPQVADIAPNEDVEGMNQVTDTKDQMGAIVNEAHNPAGMGYPPQQQQPMPGQMAGAGGNNQMPPQAGCPPPMAGQPQQNPMMQMQYTMNSLAQEISRIKEALQVVNRQVKEISKPKPTSLDLSTRSVAVAPSSATVKETSGKGETGGFDNIVSKRAHLENSRREINQLNSYLHEKADNKKRPGVQ